MQTRCAVAAIAALAATLTAVSPALATFPGENGRLAFERERAGAGGPVLDVLTMNPDGTDQTRLNTDETHDTRPDWSPDGHRIVVSSRLAAIPPTEPRVQHVFAMHGDGTCRTQLTHGPAGDRAPVWSPDGRKIAFLRPTGTFRASDVFVMNPDGSGATQVTDLQSRMSSAAWSPDGGRFAVTATTQSGQIPHDWRIFVVNADGTNATQISAGASPNWSPDARFIAFDGIFVMNTDGTHRTRINADGGGPVWSPDGRKIAFTSSRDGDAEIFVMNADGTGETQITHNAVDDVVTSWQARPTTPPPSCAPAAPPDTTGPRMTIMRETVRASRRGAVSIRLRCPAGCAGRLTLRTASRVRVNRKRRRAVTLGRASFRIPAGRTAPVTVRLSRTNRRLLARLRRVRVIASVRAVDQAGNAATATGKLLLKAPRRR